MGAEAILDHILQFFQISRSKILSFEQNAAAFWFWDSKRSDPLCQNLSIRKESRSSFPALLFSQAVHFHGITEKPLTSTSGSPDDLAIQFHVKYLRKRNTKMLFKRFRRMFLNIKIICSFVARSLSSGNPLSI